MAQSRWLKSGRVKFDPSNVNREDGIIHDVIMCQAGPAKGHGIHLEPEFISDVVEYAKANYTNIGLKARFGHPSMSNDALGTEMGKFHDFRLREDQAIADLHLYKASENSPTHPGMRSWMLDMAEEDPAAIMSSIVFSEDYYYKYDDNGNKVIVENALSGEKNDKLFVKLKSLHFCDIVDEGAATDKLFSAELNKDKFAVIATEFLNEHPEVDQFVRNNPDKIVEFVENRKNDYSFNKTINQKSMKFKSTMLAILAFLGFSQKVAEEDLPEVKEDHLEQLNAELERLNTALTEKETFLADLERQNTELNSQVSELETSLADEQAAFAAFKEEAASDPSIAQGSDTILGGEPKEMAPWNQEGFGYAEKFAAGK